jgi:hypothetical protein
MGHTRARSFAVFTAILYDAANISIQALEATNKNRGNAINNNVVSVEPVALWRDEVIRQGVPGHNLLYVLGFSLLGAIIGLAVVALVVGHGPSGMLPA